MNAPLPIGVIVEDGESVISYLLRTCSIHQISILQLYRLAGLEWHGGPRYDDLPRLAKLCRVPLAWLRPRTPHPVSAERWRVAWMGHLWRSPQTLPRAQVAICPQCVHAEGAWRVEWDLEWFCACSRHRRLLITHCANCGRRLSLRGPSIDVCRCKRPFRDVGPEVDAEPRMLEWLDWVRASLGAHAEHVPMPESLAAILPGDPSPDGVWRLLWAFGVRPDGQGSAPSASRPLSPQDAWSVAQRGFRRLDLAWQRALDAKLIHASALRWQVARGSTRSDRSLAKHLMLAHFGPQALATVRRAVGEQLELFA